MLHISDISFRHGERVLFDRASAAFSDGWKVGLVGRNGAGKSTLLRLIQGQIEADSGEINLMGRTRVGSVPQDPPGGDITVLDAVLAADLERSALMAEDATCHDGLRLAEIHSPARRDRRRLGPFPRRLDPERPGFRQREAGAALRRILRRLAHARGPGRHAVQRS